MLLPLASIHIPALQASDSRCNMSSLGFPQFQEVTLVCCCVLLCASLCDSCACQALSCHAHLNCIPIEVTCSCIHLVAATALCYDQAPYWWGNESWCCAHDSSSLCTMHCALVPIIRHPL